MILTVRLAPKASRDAINGWARDVEGRPVLKCSVTAVPEKGKANKALIALLAKTLGLPKSAITITRGETDLIKTLDICMEGQDPAEIERRLGISGKMQDPP
jgi:uncharacterized protein